MTNRSTLWIALGVVFGMAVGWMAAGLQQEADPIDEPLRIGPAVDEPLSSQPPDLQGRPRAAGRNRTPGQPGANPGASDGPEPVIEFMEGSDWETVDFPFDQVDSPSNRTVQGWNALLTLYALAGKQAEFLRAADPALLAGLEPGTLLELLGLLPNEHHVATLDHVLAAYPDHTWSTAHVARLYIGAGANERAVAILVEVLDVAMDTELAVLLAEAAPDLASTRFGAEAAGGDLDLDLVENLGTALMTAGRPELALPFFENLLAADPMRRSGVMALYGADPARGLAFARDLVADHPEQANVRGWLAEILLEEGDMPGAFEAYRSAAALEMSSSYVYGMYRADPENALAVAMTLPTEGSGDDALAAVAKIAAAHGTAAQSVEMLIRAHRADPSDHEWLQAMVRMDPARCAEVLSETSESYTGGSRDEVIGAYGNALLALGQSEEAFERYRQAHELDRTDWEWQRGLARSDPRGALALLEPMAAAEDPSADLIGAVGDAYAGLGRTQDAITYYQRAYDDGGGAEWLARMAIVDPNRALTQLEPAARSKGEEAYWGALGDAYRSLGRISDARAAYQTAHDMSPMTLAWSSRLRALDE